MKECRNRSGTIINRKISIFYIETVPQLFCQLRKNIFLWDFFFNKKKRNFKIFKNEKSFSKKIFSFIKFCKGKYFFTEGILKTFGNKIFIFKNIFWKRFRDDENVVYSFFVTRYGYLVCGWSCPETRDRVSYRDHGRKCIG